MLLIVTKKGLAHNQIEIKIISLLNKVRIHLHYFSYLITSAIGMFYEHSLFVSHVLWTKGLATQHDHPHLLCVLFPCTRD